MLRLIHNQTVLGPILIDDIDDGLPNKTVHRLGSMADPDHYARDGYAIKDKQKCYIPYYKPGNQTVQGYIDIRETERVTHSSGKGKIDGMRRAGLIQVVQFVKTDLAVPVLTNAQLDVPGAGDLTITGTKLLSLTPDISTVILTGAGAVVLTMTQILAAGGVAAFTDTSIVIPAALVPGITAPGTAAQVNADDKNSNAFNVV
jgi:hypothetical protein